MIVGVGIDIVEISRIENALARDAFRQRVFTAQEQDYCDKRGRGRTASYAARFAGKEAVLKALGTGLSGGTWLDIEILPDELGKPCAKLSGRFKVLAEKRNISKFYISLTHSREYAAAQVVATGGANFEDSNCR